MKEFIKLVIDIFILDIVWVLRNKLFLYRTNKKVCKRIKSLKESLESLDKSIFDIELKMICMDLRTNWTGGEYACYERLKNLLIVLRPMKEALKRAVDSQTRVYKVLNKLK